MIELANAFFGITLLTEIKLIALSLQNKVYKDIGIEYLLKFLIPKSLQPTGVNL